MGLLHGFYGTFEPLTFRSTSLPDIAQRNWSDVGPPRGHPVCQSPSMELLLAHFARPGRIQPRLVSLRLWTEAA